jgi:hypothetical protein
MSALACWQQSTIGRPGVMYSPKIVREGSVYLANFLAFRSIVYLHKRLECSHKTSSEIRSGVCKYVNIKSAMAYRSVLAPDYSHLACRKANRLRTPLNIGVSWTRSRFIGHWLSIAREASCPSLELLAEGPSFGRCAALENLPGF